MIIVTGATGQLGSQVVARLLDRVSPDQVGVSVRDPDKARPLAQRGVRVRRGDFTEPATLTDAFPGTSRGRSSLWARKSTERRQIAERRAVGAQGRAALIVSPKSLPRPCTLPSGYGVFGPALYQSFRPRVFSYWMLRSRPGREPITKVVRWPM